MNSVVEECLELRHPHLIELAESTSTLVIELKFDVEIVVSWELLTRGIDVLLRSKPSEELIKPNWKKLNSRLNSIS